MSTFSHTIGATYESIEQAVAVTIPAHTLADAILPTSEHFDRLARAVEEADSVRAGVENFRPSERGAVHDESVALLADNLGGVEITLTTKAVLDLVHGLLAQAVDHSIVGRTAVADLEAAANLVQRVQGDEARSAAIHDRSTRRTPRQIAVMPGRVA